MVTQSSSSSGGGGSGGGARSRLDLMSPEGEGTIFYPSGRIALTACKSPDGYFYTFTSDTERFQVLATFDSDGIGGVNHPDGKPWLVVTREGWSLSTLQGRITRGGRWPRDNAAAEPITLEVSPELTVKFTDRQHIVAHLSFADVDRVLQCGEYSRRLGEGSHLDKVVRTLPGGKLELDTAAIRRRQDTIGSAYVPRGPHHRVTKQPGLGNLKSMLAGVTPDSPIAAMVADLDDSQSRVQRINTLRIEPYGTAHPPKSLAAPLADFGSPSLTASQRRMAARMEGGRATTAYVCRRRRLPLLSVAELDARVLSSGAPKDVLFAVCILADFNPMCTRLEKTQLRAAAFELAAAAAADPSGACPAAHIRTVKVSGAESTALQRRYGFRTVPMFLFAYNGEVIDAGNDVRSKQELIDRATAALAAGRQGRPLRQGLPLGGIGDSVLDSITPHMSLLRGGGSGSGGRGGGGGGGGGRAQSAGVVRG